MASLCCCCFSGENADDERRPLLQPAASTQFTTTESARQNRPAPSGDTATTHGGRLEMRRVGLSELDQRFSDVAETFNEQREHYEALARCVAHLRQSYGCSHDNTLLLSDCVNKIRDVHDLHYRISLQMKGYDFHLSAAPVESAEVRDNEPPPQRLLSAQDELRAVSQAAKMTVSLGTKLQELIGWLLRSEEKLAGQVAKAAPNYQERRRLEENLQACLREMRRGKELSVGYKQRAGEVLNEAAQLAGVEP
ncbi:uncharacterized protein si:ch73-345f18.3 isoform X1 [Gadus macrocephalus]|uniref:uncharacterized protein si:ch73-345f18.3 isoform X1 n=2 Tax=Gadus macrocephalus TaxID=80720 RepID=UPI0028CB2B17|nr:uncharacterized protein si:ch73-345f18.3 isoform X1 [Gadus macrocephalus]